MRGGTSPLARMARQVAPIGFVVVILKKAQLSLALGTGIMCAATAALWDEIGGLFVSSEVPGGKPDPATQPRDEAGFRIRRLRAQDTVRIGVRMLEALAS